MMPMSPGVSGFNKQYTYGVDAKGLMYIYDRSAGRMAYYGPRNRGEAMVNNIRMNGSRLIYEGNKASNQKRSGGAVAAPAPAAAPAAAAAAADATAVQDFGGGGGGYSAPAPAKKVLDQAQIDALNAQFGVIDSARNTAKRRAALSRDAAIREKEEELNREQGKYKGEKLSTLQDFGGAVKDTDMNTRDTLNNLISSMGVLGLGGQRELTRQITSGANRANRKANETQSKNNQKLDGAFNEFKVANQNDRKKARDQYDFEAGEAERKWAQDRQNTLYKQASVYGDADMTKERENLMRQGNDLASIISKSAFVNPRYTGQARAMATPDLADYNQDIAQYQAEVGIGADGAGASPDGVMPGNLAMRAIAVNDRDFGIKKKTEGDVAYGV